MTPLPKIQFSNLPRGVWQHLLERVEERRISLDDLLALQEWVKTNPVAPEGIGTKTSARSFCAAAASFRKPCWRGA